MIRHLFVINLRNLINSRFFAIGVISGMSVTVACLLFTVAFINKELSVDGAAKNKSVVRVLMDNPVSGKLGLTTFYNFVTKAENFFPEVKTGTFISWIPGYLSIDGNDFIEKEVLAVDTNFFKLFNCQLIESTEQPLANPFSAVLTETLALKYFGVLDSYIGKELTINRDVFSITGILKNEREINHLIIGILLSRNSFTLAKKPEILTGFTYLELENGVNQKDLKNKFNSFAADLLPYKIDKKINFKIEPAEDFYFHKSDASYSYVTDLFRYQDKEIVYLIALVMIAITILSIINYIIFSQTRILFKAKQLVVNRILGQPSTQLFFSMLIEVFIVLAISTGVGLCLFFLVSTKLNGLSQLGLSSYDLLNPKVIILCLLFFLLISILIAAINFTILPRLESTYSLSGNFSSSLSAKKRVVYLLTLQCALALFFITNCYGMLSQIIYIKNYDLGYTTKDIIEISLGDVSKAVTFKSVKNEIQNIAGVKQASVATGTPISGRWYYSETVNDLPVTINQIYADEDYLNTMQLKLLEGRDFNAQLKSDTMSIIVNETAKKVFGLKVDSTFGYSKVIGVVKDFNYNSFKESIEPVFISYSLFNQRRMQEFSLIVEVNGLQVIDEIKSLWKARFQDTYFNYFIVQSQAERLHREEFSRMNLLKAVTAICLAIVLFGSSGFSYFIVRSKKLEIAIRKTFGATSFDVGVKLYTLVILMFAVSFTISVIPSWFFLQNWLKSYSHKVNLTFLILAMPTFIVLILSIIIASFQIIKYSLINPSVSLRQQ